MAPTSPETLHGDQMGAFAHSERLFCKHALTKLAWMCGWCKVMMKLTGLKI